jgi:predicted acylesterase/phospholipase RssA
LLTGRGRIAAMITGCASRLAALVCLAPLAAGCGTALSRQAAPDAGTAEAAAVPGLAHARFWGDEVPTGNLVDELRRRMPQFARPTAYKTTPEGRPIIEYLALSGGGSDGAFGAGLLAGWSRQGTRPQFEVVTGVSAGAIIAPFAFLGHSHDRQLQEIWTEYQTSEILTAQILPGLLGGSSLADTTPLANLVARYVDRKLLRAVAAEYRRGRLLLIGTTNLDAQRPVIWNMGEIAVSSHPGAIDLFRQVIMASAAIPGAFPPVHIKVAADGKILEEMHVDGGVTREVFIAPVQIRLSEFDPLYGGRKPLRRIYIIKNGKILPEYDVVTPTTIAIASRAISTLTKSNNQGDIYRIWRMASESNAQFNLVSIPACFRVKAKEAFDPVYQRALYEQGFAIGSQGGKWEHLPPELRRSPLTHCTPS